MAAVRTEGPLAVSGKQRVLHNRGARRSIPDADLVVFTFTMEEGAVGDPQRIIVVDHAGIEIKDGEGIVVVEGAVDHGQLPIVGDR